MIDVLEDLKTFLDHSPTPWHAASQIEKRLHGFSRLDEGALWQLEAGKKYYIIRNGTIALFTLPTQQLKKALIFAAHTDSPGLKLKAKSSHQEENMQLLRVEPYGAPLLSSWLNRDLHIAGRIVVQNDKKKLEEKLISLDTPCFIPQLAIHLDREVNEKGLLLNKHDHLSPILGLKSENAQPLLEKLLQEQTPSEKILASELFLVPSEKAAFVGADRAFLSAYRLDNLASVHAAFLSLNHAKPHENCLQMALFWDNEEIGSRTKEGAASPFLIDLLQRISLALYSDAEHFFLLKQNSLCLSLDVAHAYNPNYAQRHDPQHLLLPGRGIAIKQNADQKYSSSAPLVAQIAKACIDLNLPYQYYASRADIPSGSTVGPIIAAQGIATIDIGTPLFSMHSIRETLPCQDHLDLHHLLTHLLHEA